MFKTINILVNIFIYVHFVSVCSDIKQKKHFIFFEKGKGKYQKSAKGCHNE